MTIIDEEIAKARKEIAELQATLRIELEAWFGLLNKIDKELAQSKNILKNDPIMLEVSDIRSKALKRIVEIEKKLQC
jgi:restriction endonuclease S subunit